MTKIKAGRDKYLSMNEDISGTLLMAIGKWKRLRPIQIGDDV